SAIAGVAGPASATTVSGSLGSTVTFGHMCNVVGSDGTRQGVECVDLLVRAAAEGSVINVYVSGQGEEYCQQGSASSLVQCAGAKQGIAWFEQSKSLPQSTGSSGVFTCGSFGGGACPSGSRFIRATQPIF